MYHNPKVLLSRVVGYKGWLTTSIVCLCFLFTPCYAAFGNQDLTTAVDTLLPYMTSISNYYVMNEREFSYNSADASFNFITPDTKQKAQGTSTFKKEHNIKQIQKVITALQALPHLQFYAAKRDISTYGVCRKQNYLLAISALDKKILKPNQRLNMNKLISSLTGRCSDLSHGRSFMFYEGACGASTLLFRNALLNPEIIVTKRLSHRHRYPAFYGSEIMGDDAVMFELSKQFEIKNNGTHPVYFRTWLSPGGSHVLLSATLREAPSYVTITREKVGAREGRILRKVYAADDSEKLSQQRFSRYIGLDLTADLAFAGGRRRLPSLY